MPRKSGRSFLMCAFLAVSWLACSREVQSAEAKQPESPPPAARLRKEDAAAVVQKVLPQVEEIRGLKFRSAVPVTVVNDAQAREYAVERFHRFYTDEEIAAVEKAYRLLGLIPAEANLLEQYLDVLGEQAGGFYDPSAKAFFLLDDMPAAMAPILSAHELTHALEDQHYDLDARLTEAKNDDDLGFAMGAVHEGSATIAMGLFAARAMMNGSLAMQDLQLVAESEAGKGEKLSAMPQALRRPLLGAYLLGARFLLRGNPAAIVSGTFPSQDVDRAFRDGPKSSEQILHPEKYWDAAKRDDPKQVTLEDAGRVLGEGWKRTGSGTLGELLVGVLVEAPTPSAEAMGAVTSEASDWTNAAASGWGGDRWELWRRGDESVVLLETVWDTPTDAEEFANALPVPRPGFAWKRRGARAAFVAGSATDKTEELLERLLGAISGTDPGNGP